VFSRQFFALDEDQRENLRRERRRLQEQLRRVRRQDRLQQRNTTLPTNTTADHHSPSSRSTNPSPIRHLHLQLNNPDLSSFKLADTDLLVKNDGLLDENHPDLLMDTSHNITSASQLFSTSMENLNSNSQSGFANYFSSTSFGDDGQENNEMISPTVSANGADPSGKRRKKSEKDLKWVKRMKMNILFDFVFFFLVKMRRLWCSGTYENQSCLSNVRQNK
jgi:hypothetical protein